MYQNETDSAISTPASGFKIYRHMRVETLKINQTMLGQFILKILITETTL